MKKVVLLFCTFLALTLNARANIILSDSFTYPDGDIFAAPGSPWVVHSGATPANVASGQLKITSANSADVNALLAGAPYTTNSAAVLYASFKVKPTALPTAIGAYFAHFKDTNSGAATGFGARIWVSISNVVDMVLLPASTVRFGIANGASGSVTNGQYPLDVTLNTTVTVVTRFVPATGQSTLWINPNAESDFSVTANDVGTVTRPNPIDVVAYAFRQNSGEGTLLIDDLRVGTTFADVAGPNNPPVISGIPNQSTGAGVPTGSIPFVIGDAETAASALTLSASSTNQSLVPTANIVFAGSGSNRTVTITPVSGQQGATTITLTVTDAGNLSSSTSFQLAVGLPSISDLPNQQTPEDTIFGPVPFSVSDRETPVANLTVSGKSSNQALVPDANITFGGSGSARTVTITPSAGQAGLATITITVSDGTVSSSDTFVLTVNPLLGILRSDDFDRPDGPLVQFDGLWLSNGGSGGAHAQEMQILGHRIQVTEDGSEDVSTEMPPNQPTTPSYSPASGTILYESMKVNFNRLPTAESGGYFAHFRDAGNNFRARIYVNPILATPGQYQLGIANQSTAVAGQLPDLLSTGTDYTIVVRYNVGTGESKLWLNPRNENSPGVAATDTPNVVPIEALSFRQNPGIGVVFIDDLKIGTAFSDVATVLIDYNLSIARSGTSITVSWPSAATADGYILESATTLSPADWQPAPETFSSAGGTDSVILTNPSGNRYFRLRK
jgi:hypothetical protein